MISISYLHKTFGLGQCYSQHLQKTHQLYGLGFKILVFQDEFFHFDWIQDQSFQAAEDIGMFAGKKGSDLFR
jgi:hypothetical protein